MDRSVLVNSVFLCLIRLLFNLSPVVGNAEGLYLEFLCHDFGEDVRS